ncbi:MAG TPA: HDOD domain-containing protein [Gammaproteobacteria bacterium]|nr:HDOD domain-containing protein [Gammaproteobacteria bacterium]
MPALPALVHAFSALEYLNEDDMQPALSGLTNKYPLFFDRVLKTINIDVRVDAKKAAKKKVSLYQAIGALGFKKVQQQLQVLVVYNLLNQYKIKGVEMPLFWQDSLRRAVSARRLAVYANLDAQQCFVAGFLQDAGFILMLLAQPEKALLWREFRRRDPQARLSMEQNIFNQRHDEQLMQFLQSSNILLHLQAALSSHHATTGSALSETEAKMAQVLQCADWMSAVFSADDKSHVINWCHTLVPEKLQITEEKTDEILHSITAEVECAGSVYDIEIGECVRFSQVMHEANTQLHNSNANFQEIAQRLDRAIEERDKLAAEINRELLLAREIQQSLLPDEREDSYPVHGINCPARLLSGDFYDFFELRNGDIYFNLGDVSGKGVNAALLMAKTSSLFRCMGKRISTPGKLLYDINNELCETAIHGMFVTLVAGLYSPAKAELKLVNAGNPPALLLSESGICREFEATAPPLGIIPDTDYTEYDITLNNDTLYLYSDGVTEGYIDETSMLGLSGLFRLVSTMDAQLTSAQRLKRIVDKLTHHTSVLRDDATLLILQSKPGHVG